jgi:peptidoglycan/xylan/chitin deacetylase (PgdA/CDA1 family)
VVPDDPEHSAFQDVTTWKRSPELLWSLPLGAFEEAPALEVAARRVLLALRMPALVVWAFARLSRGRSRAQSLVTSYRYWRAVRRALRDDELWRRLTQGTTILMYHAIASDGERASRFVLPRRSFERQMRWLARRRTVVRLEDVVADRRSQRLPPAGKVVITFDDGHLDNATTAAPVLSELGLAATFFVVTGALGDKSRWETPPELAERPIMSWEDAAKLRDDGFEIGAHTRTHPNLTRLDPTARDTELAGSREDLRRRLNVPADSFAYPYGAWDAIAADGARRAGYASACTVRTGRNGASTPPHELRRTEIRGTDSFFRFLLGVVVGDTRVVDELLAGLGPRSRG